MGERRWRWRCSRGAPAVTWLSPRHGVRTALPEPCSSAPCRGRSSGLSRGTAKGPCAEGRGGGWRPNRVTRGPPPAPCPSVLLPPHSGCPYGRRAAEPPGNCCSAAIVRLGVRLLPSHMGYCLHMWVIATSRAAIHTRPGGVPTCGTLPVWGLTCLWGGFVAKNPCVWDTPASQKPSS